MDTHDTTLLNMDDYDPSIHVSLQPPIYVNYKGSVSSMAITHVDIASRKWIVWCSETNSCAKSFDDIWDVLAPHRPRTRGGRREIEENITIVCPSLFRLYGNHTNSYLRKSELRMYEWIEHARVAIDDGGRQLIFLPRDVFEDSVFGVPVQYSTNEQIIAQNILDFALESTMPSTMSATPEMEVSEEIDYDVSRDVDSHLVEDWPDTRDITESEEIESPSPITCCICFSEFEDFFDLQHDLLTYVPWKCIVQEGDDMLLTNVIIMPPCRRLEEDGVCAGCLRRWLNNYSNHPIGSLSSNVQCLFDGCMDEWKDVDVFAPILTLDEMKRLKAHAEKFKKRKVLSVPCKKCDADVCFDADGVINVSRGDLIQTCTTCSTHICYHCGTASIPGDHNPILRNHETNRDICGVCCGRYLPLPNKINNYFVPADCDNHRFKDGVMGIRNSDITAEMLANRVKELLHMSYEDSFMKCACCLTLLYRTEGCNRVKHCGAEMCAECGFRMYPNETCIGSSHFAEGGGRCHVFTMNEDYLNYGKDYALSTSHFPYAPAMCSSRCTNGDDCPSHHHEEASKVRSIIRIERHLVKMLESVDMPLRSRLYPEYLTKEEYDALNQLVRRYKKHIC